MDGVCEGFYINAIFKECCPDQDAVIRNCTSFPITCNGHPGHFSNAFDLSNVAGRVKLHFPLKCSFLLLIFLFVAKFK